METEIQRSIPPIFSKPTCRGSYVLGTACGNCERCEWERITTGIIPNHPETMTLEFYLPGMVPLKFEHCTNVRPSNDPGFLLFTDAEGINRKSNLPVMSSEEKAR